MTDKSQVDEIVDDLVPVPVGDRIIVQPITTTTFADGKLVLPETADQKPQMGYVVAAGTGHLKESGVYNLEVREGELIVFSKYSGAQVEIEGNKYIVIREEDVFCRMLSRDYILDLIREDEEIEGSFDDYGLDGDAEEYIPETTVVAPADDTQH